MHSKAYIQIQDFSGNWINVNSTMNSPQIIMKALETAKKTYRTGVARAVDQDGNILQLQE